MFFSLTQNMRHSTCYVEALYFKCFIILSKLEMLKEFGKFPSVKFSDPKLDEKAIIETK